MVATPVAEDIKVVHGVCPHDCPDTCSFQVTVKDGVAVAIEGDTRHPVTHGFLCVKVNNYLERTYNETRVLTPRRRVGPKGLGLFEEISWDEALDEIAARFKAIIAQRRRRGDPAVQLQRHARPAAQREHGLPLLQPPRRERVGPDDLLRRGRRGDRPHARREDGHRPGDVHLQQADRRLGLQPGLDEPAPDALHQEGAAERRATRRHRPAPHAHRRAGGLAHPAAARHGRRARPRRDARPHRRGHDGRGVSCGAHARLRGAARAGDGVPARPRRRDHRADRGGDCPLRAALRDGRSPP